MDWSGRICERLSFACAARRPGIRERGRPRLRYGSRGAGRGQGTFEGMRNGVAAGDFGA
jgi:hypothetical protein